MDHQNTDNNSPINWLLSILIGIFTIIEQSSADDIYKWFFRALSLISLMLIIIINWKKAMLVLFPNKNKSDGKF